jgi:hypothetical protein
MIERPYPCCWRQSPAFWLIGVVVGRLAIPLSETSNVSTGGSPILKSTQSPHIPKAGSAPFGIATNFILPQGAGIFPQDARSPGCRLEKEISMDTALTLPWEYLIEQTETTETFTRFEALDLAGVLAGCIADVGFAATDKHRWAQGSSRTHIPQSLAIETDPFCSERSPARRFWM